MNFPWNIDDESFLFDKYKLKEQQRYRFCDSHIAEGMKNI